MPFKAEVIADRSGKWVSNQLRFLTREEAEDYVRDLARGWSLVTATQVVESDDLVNCVFDKGRTVHLPEPVVEA